MQFSLALVLLALSAGTHAKVAALGSFAAPDCSGDIAGTWTQEDYLNCVPFDGAQTNNIGVNWHRTLDEDSIGVHVYRDRGCTQFIKTLNATAVPDKVGTWNYFSYSDNCGPWGSVMWSHTPGDQYVVPDPASVTALGCKGGYW